MKKKSFITAIAILLFLILLGNFYHLYNFARGCWGWAIGDWLVNFQAGFVRRGLSGYLTGLLSGLFHLKLNMTMMLLQMMFYAACMSVFFLLFYRKKLNAWFLAALFSPATLLFTVFDANAAGRKEIILFFLFAVYLLLLKKGALKSVYAVLIFSIALLAATLFHELVFFYTPYFFLAAWLQAQTDHTPFNVSKSILAVAGSWLIILPIYFFGRNIDGYAICEGLKAQGLPDSICLGILSWPADYGVKNVIQFAGESHYLFVYGTTFLLSLIPFLLLVRSLNVPGITLKRFTVVLFFLLVFSSPLFFLAVDWGRWLNIHFMLLLFSATLLLKNNTAETGSNILAEFPEVPRLWTGKTTFSKSLNNTVFFVLALSYVAFWSMPHFGYSPVFSLTKNFYSVKHLATDVFHALFHFFKSL